MRRLEYITGRHQLWNWDWARLSIAVSCAYPALSENDPEADHLSGDAADGARRQTNLRTAEHHRFNSSQLPPQASQPEITAIPPDG